MPNIAHDKLAHSFWFTLGYLGLLITATPPLIALGITLLTATGKEVRDMSDPENHTAEWKDIFYSVLIPSIFTAYLYFISYLLFGGII